MIDLDKIRAVFPEWPSELKVAKVPGNWASRAQAFFCAAKVLNEESEQAHREIHARAGEVLSENILIRNLTQLAAEFCLAFSIELAIKAALVAQGKLDHLTSGGSLPFDNHKLKTLAKEIDGLDVTADVESTLQWAADFVLNGKYPVPKKPNEEKNGVTITKSFYDLIAAAEPIYRRLMELQSR
jgi:hypothetical protein